MIDVTNNIASEKQIPYALYTFGDSTTYEINAADAGITAADTYHLVNIPEGKVFAGGTVIVYGDATSTGNATLTFTVGSCDVTDAIPVVNLKRGATITLDAGKDGSCKSSVSGVTPVKITVGSAPFTSLKFVLSLKTVDISKVG